MDSHSHDHSHDTKPVAFIVPIILALVVVIAMGLFLSLCDPDKHHGSHEATATEAAGHH